MELNENSYISGPEFPTRRNSDSSQAPLTEPMKRPIGNCWYFWYKNESLILLTLVIVNVILILINLPILATVMNRLNDVKGMHKSIIITHERLRRVAGESDTANRVSIFYICRVLGHLS